ncbi:hypothetical protein C8J57DRAFT_1523792 [Mycena rebaudengoi]|nr:hypothetical protein C8J57DRAFT_1523792 [Mycena rebaudengoi]
MVRQKAFDGAPYRNPYLKVAGIYKAVDIPHLPLVHTLEIKLLVGARSPRVPPSLSKIARTFPNIELLTLVFMRNQHRPDQPVHCQLLPRDRRHDFSAAFAHFCSAMDEQLACFRETGILRCSLADTSPRFFRHLPFYQLDLVNL